MNFRTVILFGGPCHGHKVAVEDGKTWIECFEKSKPGNMNDAYNTEPPEYTRHVYRQTDYNNRLFKHVSNDKY